MQQQTTGERKCRARWQLIAGFTTNQARLTPMKRTLRRRSAVILSARDPSPDDRVTESDTSHLALRSRTHCIRWPAPNRAKGWLTAGGTVSAGGALSIMCLAAQHVVAHPPSTRPVCARPYALPRAKGEGGGERGSWAVGSFLAFVRSRSFIGACSTRSQSGTPAWEIRDDQQAPWIPGETPPVVTLALCSAWNPPGASHAGVTSLVTSFTWFLINSFFAVAKIP